MVRALKADFLVGECGQVPSVEIGLSQGGPATICQATALSEIWAVERNSYPRDKSKSSHLGFVNLT